MTAMTDLRWTSSQLAAIRTGGASILVSAGAGSGKTAVLAERCAHLVADAQPPCPVDRLLVVTFTDAAATQMRQRIAEALQQRLTATPANSRLQQQLALLDTDDSLVLPPSPQPTFCPRGPGSAFAGHGRQRCRVASPGNRPPHL
jgi:ATP-dependent exoDNAse (exonuclease V) beta subunit